jgi:peptide/nickel transport system substrate-binding protein
VWFNDGAAFTADDVIATLRRIPAIPDSPGPYISSRRSITSTEAVDPYTIRVTTDQPNPLLPGRNEWPLILYALSLPSLRDGH